MFFHRTPTRTRQHCAGLTCSCHRAMALLRCSGCKRNDPGCGAPGYL